ncbi:hypothetical protein RFI_00920, partial [Reticulomyxa filosa]
NNNNNNNTNNNNNNSNNTHGKSQSVTISSTQSTATYTANSEVADHTTTTSSTTATQASPWLPNQNQGSGNDIKILKPRDQNSNSLQQINLQYSTRQTSQTAEVESSNEDEESDELERMIRASEKQTYDGIYGPSDSEFVSSHDKKQSVTSGVSETLPEEKETEFHEENNIKTKETVAATPTSATSTPTTTATASTASAPASRPSVILEEDSKQEQDTVVNRDSIDGEKDKKSKTLPGFNMKGLTQGFSKIKDKIQESTFKTTTNTKKPNKNLGMCVILSLSLYNIFFFLRNVYIIFFFLRREAVCMYVVVCCQDNNPFVNFRFEPKIIDRFPFLDHADTEIVTTGSQLQYFCLPTGLFLTRFPSLPIFFTFVWTPASGDRIFGACLRFFEPVPIHVVKEDFFFFFFYMQRYYAPKCICLISYHPFIEAYRIFLTELYRLSLTPSNVPIERYLCNFFLETPLPPRGYFSVRYRIGDKALRIARPPQNNPLIEQPLSTQLLFELFDLDTLLHIYTAMLLEKKILLLSTQYSILTLVAEMLCSLLYPFDWPHAFIPLLPEDFLAFLKAPTVFLIGTHTSLVLALDDLPDDMMIVDINTSSIKNLPEMPTLPKHELTKLKRYLQPVSDLFFGIKSQEFHQLDLAFPVAPTPDQIEERVEMNEKRRMEAENRDVSTFSKLKKTFAFRHQKKHANEVSASQYTHRDSIDPPLRVRRNSNSVSRSGTVDDVLAGSVALQFDDFAVRSSFLRVWLSVFRNYNEFIIRPKMYGTNARDMSVTLTGSYLQAPAVGKNRTASMSISDSSSSLDFWNALTLEKMFELEKFIKASPSGSKAFLTALSQTETFYVRCFSLCLSSVSRFIEKRAIREDIDHDVVYFDEKIVEKLSRSRFAKAKATPFLQNADYSISHEFEVPPPFIDDLEQS